MGKLNMQTFIASGEFTRLRLLPILVASLLLGVEVHAAEKPDARPSILFCLADDWAWPHAGVYGDKVVQTPVFDRLAREGMLFSHGFSPAPSCTASRGSILTGQAPHRLEAGADLWSALDKQYPVYPDLLEQAGYFVGYTRKGWAPGNFKAGERPRNPAGPSFKDFAGFLASAPKDKPFCFWFGSLQPHRPYKKGCGAASGLQAADVRLPAFLPDSFEVRNDILDYYHEVSVFDTDVGQLIAQLKTAGRLENTLIVITGDNGSPFPRAKANLYDSGTRQPLVAWWPAKIKPGQVSDEYVSLTDLAPTLLEAAGLQPLPAMTGHSFFGRLTGKDVSPNRQTVFLERERHASARAGNVSYPMRAIRTTNHLYLENLLPERWPAGDPDIGKGGIPYHDVDNGPAKEFLLRSPEAKWFFNLAFGKRPAEELFDLVRDPGQLHNVAGQPEYEAIRAKLRLQLDQWRRETADPTLDDKAHFDQFRYFGNGG